MRKRDTTCNKVPRLELIWGRCVYISCASTIWIPWCPFSFKFGGLEPKQFPKIKKCQCFRFGKKPLKHQLGYRVTKTEFHWKCFAEYIHIWIVWLESFQVKGLKYSTTGSKQRFWVVFWASLKHFYLFCYEMKTVQLEKFLKKRI